MRRPRSGFAALLFAAPVVIASAALSGPLGHHANDASLSDSVRYGTICKKLLDSSCQSDTSRNTVFYAAELDKVAITYMLKNGTVVSDTFSPQRVEAIFFTASAANRLLPSYWRRIKRFSPDSVNKLSHGWGCRGHDSKVARGSCPP